MVKKLMESRRTLRNVLIGSLSLLLDRDLMQLLPSFSLLLCLPFFSLFLFLARPAADHSAHTPIITPFQYPITTFTQSHKSAPTQVSRPQDFWPTSRLTRPAVRSVEKQLVQQASQHLERLSEKTARPPSLSPPPPEDDEMEDSTTIKGDSYEMKGALHPGQDRQVQFEDQNDGVYDRPTAQHYQRKTSKAQEVAEIQFGRSLTKETIPIEMKVKPVSG